MQILKLISYDGYISPWISSVAYIQRILVALAKWHSSHTQD